MSISIEKIDLKDSTIQVHDVTEFKISKMCLSKCDCETIEIKTREQKLTINLYLVNNP